MVNILILGREISLSENQKTITKKHIITTLDFIEILDENAKKYIYKYFNIKPNLKVYPRLKHIGENIPLNIKNMFDLDVIKFVFALKEKGFPEHGLTKFYEEPAIEDIYSEEFMNFLIDNEEVEKVSEPIQVSTLNKQKARVNEGFKLLKTAIEIKETLSSKLYGQDKAIESISDSIKNNILANTNTPKNTYLFLGPPATGKTYLAELLSEYLDEYKIKRFDMTQYTHKESGGYLYGTARFWGNTKPGSLTSFVRENPKSIILLDEFEKADNAVQTNLLTIFEGGFLQDACGWCPNNKPWGSPGEKGQQMKCPETEVDDIVDFKKTIFIITSNLGKELYTDSKFVELIQKDYTQAESMIIETLKREKKSGEDSKDGQPAIVPELLSRLSQAHIVLFDNLTYQAFEAIADNAFMEYKKAFCRKFNLSFDIQSDYKIFLKTQILLLAPELNARRVKSKIGINFFDKITDFFMTFGENMPEFSKVEISISDNVKEYLSEYIDIHIQNNKLVNELFRKNLTLDIEEKFSYEDGIVTYYIKDCSLLRIAKIKDFAEDGLVFDIPDISFKDIAGHKMAKTRLEETIKFLKHPKYLKDFKIDSPRGMLLYGPSGTGKTLLAKAFAHEANLPFIAVTGSDLLDLEKIESIFKKAKEYAPSIVFIDEIDAIGSRDDNSNREIFINQFISELDGFSSNTDESVFVIAATNYKNKIDDAILRPGRIELHIQINSLDKEARKYFLQNILDTKPINGEFDMNMLLMYTTGMTGAQLELIGKEASIYCIRKNLTTITQDILIEQINIIKYGAKIQHKNLESVLEETAIHEAGHAILHKILMPHIKIEQVTVVPREDTLGFVSYNNEDNISNLTIKDIKNKIIIAFAGRLSQIKKYGKNDGIDTGASSDLKQATHYAYIAITKYGMDDELGYINLEEMLKINKNYYSEKIDKTLHKWLQEAKESAEKLIDTHWDKIEKLTQLLLEKEVVFEGELNF